ncbi:MAG: D-erythronate dehydrogenase [Rhizobiaceae bacterium]
MVKVLITGGGGMIGQKLASRLAREKSLCGQAISKMILHDIASPGDVPADFAISKLTGDLADLQEAQRLAALQADVVFHLAGVVSGEAETNFDKGWAVNAHGTWQLLEAIRAKGSTYRPRFVFSSSIAVFGAPFPDIIPDEFFNTPLTSYGAQKAFGELLVSDYSRKGFIDGISLRLPTVCVRPGKANMAASSFFSGIIREPLNGQEAILPVPDTVRHWFASPKATAGFLVHAANLDLSRLGWRRALTMPGLCCSVADQIEALREIAGAEVADRIRFQPDERIMAIVSNWPERFEARRALDLGFTAERDFREIIRLYIDEDLRG